MRTTKMSKSLRNVITPDETVARFGADALRLYELFMAPFDQEVTWDENGINGTSRFLGRIWELTLRTWEEAGGERFERPGRGPHPPAPQDGGPGHRGPGALPLQHHGRGADGVRQRPGRALPRGALEDGPPSRSPSRP